MPCESFDFDLGRAVVDQLREKFDQLPEDPLNDEILNVVENRRGVYQLYYQGRMVYVGKADKSIKTRLRKHHKTLLGRQNIDMALAGFKGQKWPQLFEQRSPCL